MHLLASCFFLILVRGSECVDYYNYLEVLKDLLFASK